MRVTNSHSTILQYEATRLVLVICDVFFVPSCLAALQVTSWVKTSMQNRENVY